tara:strand:+ start:1940 stop:2440 length:501 start_codon:yes stop_codon:yes gene_type:complete
MLHFGLALFGAAAAADVTATALRWRDRSRLFKRAQEVAKARGKPLLVVGRPFGWSDSTQSSLKRHGCGDVCIDITGCPECQQGHKADVSDLSRFEDNSFGAAFASCVMEHVDDLPEAWRELNRVTGGNVFVVHPQKWAPFAYHCPSHKWYIEEVDGRRMRAGRIRG